MNKETLKAFKKELVGFYTAAFSNSFIEKRCYSFASIYRSPRWGESIFESIYKTHPDVFDSGFYADSFFDEELSYAFFTAAIDLMNKELKPDKDSFKVEDVFAHCFHYKNEQNELVLMVPDENLGFWLREREYITSDKLWQGVADGKYGENLWTIEWVPNELADPEDRGILGALFATRSLVRHKYRGTNYYFDPYSPNLKNYYGRYLDLYPISLSEFVDEMYGDQADSINKRLSAIEDEIRLMLQNFRQGRSQYDESKHRAIFKECILAVLLSKNLTTNPKEIHFKNGSRDCISTGFSAKEKEKIESFIWSDSNEELLRIFVAEMEGCALTFEAFGKIDENNQNTDCSPVLLPFCKMVEILFHDLLKKNFPDVPVIRWDDRLKGHVTEEYTYSSDEADLLPVEKYSKVFLSDDPAVYEIRRKNEERFFAAKDLLRSWLGVYRNSRLHKDVLLKKDLDEAIYVSMLIIDFLIILFG